MGLRGLGRKDGRNHRKFRRVNYMGTKLEEVKKCFKKNLVAPSVDPLLL